MGGVSLAEAYMARSLHKKEMEKLQKGRAEMENDCDFVDEERAPKSGCFFWVSKKRPCSTKVFSSADSAQNHPDYGENMGG